MPARNGLLLESHTRGCLHRIVQRPDDWSISTDHSACIESSEARTRLLPQVPQPFPREQCLSHVGLTCARRRVFFLAGEQSH